MKNKNLTDKINKELDLIDRCVYYCMSRIQRQNEINRGLGTKGTEGFEEIGCYDCKGNNNKCIAYFNPKEVYDNARTKR